MYLGNQPALSYTSFAKQDFTTSATTSYTLDNPVTNENEIALFINFVRQEPTTAYTASGTSLTLTSATSASDDMYCVFLGKAVQTVNPPNGSVGTAQLANDAVTTAKILDANVTSAKLASGVLPTNTPAFHATTSNTSAPSATFTTAIYSVSDRDTNNLYDTSTGIFTVTSSTTGYYFFYASVGSAIITANRLQVNLVKNGSTYLLTSEAQSDTSGYPAWNVSGVIPLLSSGDNVRVRWYQNSGSSKNLTNEKNKNFFGGYKIIE